MAVTPSVDAYPPHVRDMLAAWSSAERAVQKMLRLGTRIRDLDYVRMNEIQKKAFISPFWPGDLSRGWVRTLNPKIRPHDLRVHSATYTSRNGVPLKVISEVIQRHQDLKTTQMRLGKGSELEALRCMDVLQRK
jgi:hypothetical protein